VWTLSDESLLTGLGAGDPEASTAFIRRFQHRVFGLALTILGDRKAAEDASQEAFSRAWRHAGAYDPRRGGVATWLLTITRNVSVDMVRMQRVDPVEPGTVVAMIEARSERNAEAVDDYAVKDDIDRLREALSSLPEEQKRTLVLAAFLGHTTGEISALEDVPQGTVKTRLRTAIRKLRKSMEVRDEH
jgi:RNA polymerase sigma-70 factor (ECF subfamily)